MLYSPTIMDAAGQPIAPRLHVYEKWTLAVLVTLFVVMAVEGMGRKERDMYQQWLDHAQAVTQALERFAADHDGRFPPDAMSCERPSGLDDSYIRWNPNWRIDYEVRANEQGGDLVCLEFGGLLRERRYFGLCNQPELRRLYGRGQPIPGYINRIWVVREQAPIALPDATQPEPQPGR